MMRHQRRQGQATAEYAMLLGVAIAFLIGMQLFVRRGMQAKAYDVTTYFTSQVGDNSATLGSNFTSQYEPYYAKQDLTTAVNQSTTDIYTPGGQTTKTINMDSQTRTGSSEQGTDLTADDSWTGTGSQAK